MSIQKVNHPGIRPVEAEELTVSGGATPAYTSDWIDVNGWTDKVVTIDQDTSTDTSYVAHVSNQHYYELKNKTCTTEDYTAITILANNSTLTQLRVDSDDVDDLKHPWRSVRFVVTNNDGENAAVVTVDIEGLT